MILFLAQSSTSALTAGWLHKDYERKGDGKEEFIVGFFIGVHCELLFNELRTLHVSTVAHNGPTKHLL